MRLMSGVSCKQLQFTLDEDHLSAVRLQKVERSISPTSWPIPNGMGGRCKPSQASDRYLVCP